MGGPLDGGGASVADTAIDDVIDDDEQPTSASVAALNARMAAIERNQVETNQKLDRILKALPQH